MQKKLITVAVASALAVPGIAAAQSTVEVYGTINMAFGQFKYGQGSIAQLADGAPAPADVAGVSGQQASVSKFDVSQGASNYGLRARENLGGGLAAWGQFEQNAPLERSNNIAITPASRNSAVGLQGGFGNIFMGQWTTPWADLDALWGIGTVGYWGPVTSTIGRRETTGTAPNYNCVNGHLSGGAAIPGTTVCDAIEAGGGVGHPFWRRASQSLFYQSPVMAGVQVKVMYQTNEGKATSTASTNADPSMYSGSVQWAGMGGRARVGAAYDRHKDFTSIGAADTGYTVKGGWNFGVVDIGFAYEVMTYKCKVMAPGAAGSMAGLCADEGDIKSKGYALAFAVPVGPGSIRGSYSILKDMEGVIGTAPVLAAGAVVTPGTKISETGAKQYNIGYEHRFSKRTNVGVGYAKVDNKANAQITWTGAPPNQNGASNTPLFGSDVSTFFVSMTHRF